mmetsp:Transcript_14696/g.16309  ORF Transcript_14696/g.16309 Transcript_14696/m.16309 type:complete len:242 (+) Transcript_14696:123-848(+)|eukprot:CAMPEP_0168519306 /NCGR_PEP_ID=MMETSP0405-20121227/7238_1 /TAXON_ID=498012 /ORGANISM="Trichosphaerium sp, Strain Am-I-7 wt" /LENGTH=241 /DNA_ID=CAMNT_0008539821 /DNA_START=49 /DNA_END=774 /DNA_ORIENTATION=+
MDKQSVPAPETVLKKRQIAKKRAETLRRRLKQRKEANVRHTEMAFKRAEQYVTEYTNQEKEEVRLQREAKAKGGFYVKPEAKIALAVRIRGVCGVHPKIRKTLSVLRLDRINTATIVKLNASTKEMLRICGPYIAWGYPSLETVRKLVYKRGYARMEKNRIRITNNEMIAEALGKHGVICMEDVVHELWTASPKFKFVNRWLWPFKLNSPRGGITKRTHFVEGGDAGNREELINRFVAPMI